MSRSEGGDLDAQRLLSHTRSRKGSGLGAGSGSPSCDLWLSGQEGCSGGGRPRRCRGCRCCRDCRDPLGVRLSLPKATMAGGHQEMTDPWADLILGEEGVSE